ncbi:WD40-repeat-containing domain protein [Catenaria anguillulae PL171]|uniref:WD40-repeat-containing domain protein n=1 Tax=Catenaria anguillulae PL171 TaxID=765915 RepID=A0A1Y2HTJ4_9FUNG|nr:WD40-repeat-containing domain protein [Catenaria anguillulae PL171]
MSSSPSASTKVSRSRVGLGTSANSNTGPAAGVRSSSRSLVGGSSQRSLTGASNARLSSSPKKSPLSGGGATGSKPGTAASATNLLADLFNRAAVSDFSVVKQLLNEMPMDEVLLVQDVEWKFGQNYIICLSEDARDKFLTMPKVADPDSADPATFQSHQELLKPQRPAGWTCLGSDREIDEERVFPTREPVFQRLTRKRRKFGQEFHFNDFEVPLATLDIKPNPVIAHTVARMQLQKGVQAVSAVADGSAQTTWFRKVNSSVQYEPRTLSDAERHDLLASEPAPTTLAAAASKIEKVLEQNNVMNIFRNDLAHLGDEDQALDQGTNTSLQEYQSFTDLKYSKDKSIACAAWHPSQKGVLAVSCTQRATLEERVAHGFAIRSKQSLVLVWSFYDPIHPQLILEAHEDVGVFAFHPQMPHILAGGCVNGQIVVWDISEFQEKMRNKRREDGSASTDGEGGSSGPSTSSATSSSSSAGNANKHVDIDVIKPVAVSSIEHSHRGAVSDLTWSLTEVNHNGEIQKQQPTATHQPPTHASEKGQAADASATNGHTTPVPADNADHPQHMISQLVSVGLDGALMFWDLRYKKDLKSLDQVWRPLFRAPLLAMDGTFDYGLTRVALDAAASVASNTALVNSGGGGAAAVGAKFGSTAAGLAPTSHVWCATEEGDVIQADWLFDKDGHGGGGGAAAGSEKGNSRVGLVSGVHYGPVSDVVRSPIFPDVLLSVGAWSCNVWTDKCATPLVASGVGNVNLTCGVWSQTRPGVFFVGRADGLVEIWDMLDRTHQASQVQAVSSAPISAISVQTYYSKGHPTHQFIAIGDDDGTVHVLEVPRNLFRAGKNEKAFIRALLDREIKRVGFVAERRAFRAQEKMRSTEPKEGGGAEGGAPSEDAGKTSGGAAQMEGDVLEKAFHDMEASVLEMLQGAA